MPNCSKRNKLTIVEGALQTVGVGYLLYKQNCSTSLLRLLGRVYKHRSCANMTLSVGGKFIYVSIIILTRSPFKFQCWKMLFYFVYTLLFTMSEKNIFNSISDVQLSLISFFIYRLTIV